MFKQFSRKAVSLLLAIMMIVSQALPLTALAELGGGSLIAEQRYHVDFLDEDGNLLAGINVPAGTDVSGFADGLLSGGGLSDPTWVNNDGVSLDSVTGNTVFEVRGGLMGAGNDELPEILYIKGGEADPDDENDGCARVNVQVQFNNTGVTTSAGPNTGIKTGAENELYVTINSASTLKGVIKGLTLFFPINNAYQFGIPSHSSFANAGIVTLGAGNDYGLDAGQYLRIDFNELNITDVVNGIQFRIPITPF